MESLAELLRADLGETFPVASGNGKRDDPLVVTELRDYVAVEYAVAHHVLDMLREERQLASQHLHRHEDRVIDELVFDVKSQGATEWEGIRRFFFDVSAGFLKT